MKQREEITTVQNDKNDIDFEKLAKVYDASIPSFIEGWALLVKALKVLGWKNFYFCVLHLQRLAGRGSGYQLKKNH